MYSKREAEILKLRSEGLTHYEIAAKLGITEKTSRQTVSNANRVKKAVDKQKKS